jgi:glycosyltransferase involved in cell wall biosynthesis
MSERLPGVSFVVRARNEEDHLGACLASLKDVTIPHEIVVILHLCTDRSKEIALAAAETQPVRIIEYNRPVSRAGYEMLMTPASHESSLVQFYNFCFSQARYVWQFKWDADFFASPELVTFLNTELDVAETTPVTYRVPCCLGDDKTTAERYLFNCLSGYGKYVFWEIPVFAPHQQRVLSCCIKSLPPSTVKTYWDDKPWFADGVDTVMEIRYNNLVRVLGPEPKAMARTSNPECQDIEYQAYLNELVFKEVDIYLYK